MRLVCPHCDAVNRVIPDRLTEQPNCGQCHQPLLTGEPIELTDTNFDRHVGSSDLPVLVDFWAPWCGPCKTLGPVLEKLEVAYGGRFKLVKINTEEEQQLAAMFGIRSIPTCYLMVGGQPVDGFAGALPEGQIRAFLDKHLPSADELQADTLDEQAHDALASGDVEGALEQLQHAVATDPSNQDARFDYVKLLLQLGHVEEARLAFTPVQPQAASVRRLGEIGRAHV